jgi:hypothetical protein
MIRRSFTNARTAITEMLSTGAKANSDFFPALRDM